MFVLGIGEDADPSELQQIASGPKNVFKVDSFEDLDVKSNEYNRGICYLGILRSAALCSFSFFLSFFFILSAEQNLRNYVIKTNCNVTQKRQCEELHFLNKTTLLAFILTISIN